MSLLPGEESNRDTWPTVGWNEKEITTETFFYAHRAWALLDTMLYKHFTTETFFMPTEHGLC